jgi:hypothetical protein
MRYATLATVSLLHAFNLDGQCHGVRLLPAADTLSALAGLRVLVRFVSGQLFLLIETDSGGSSTVSAAVAAPLRFYLIVDDPTLFQRSRLPAAFDSVHRIFVTTGEAQTFSGQNYLSRVIGPLDVAKPYASGDLVMSGGDLFECIAPLAPDPGNTTGDGAHWFARGALRSPSAQDVFPFVTGTVEIDLPAPVTNATVTFHTWNVMTGIYDIVTAISNLVFDSPKGAVPVDFQGLPSGCYRVKANNTEAFYYYDPLVTPSSILGVIELRTDLSPASDYALLDGAGALKSPRFVLQFLNPLATWTYIARTSNVKTIKDQAGLYIFANPQPQIFQSTAPIPMAERPYNSIALDYKPAASPVVTYAKLPNPSPEHLQPAASAILDVPNAEIFLTY